VNTEWEEEKKNEREGDKILGLVGRGRIEGRWSLSLSKKDNYSFSRNSVVVQCDPLAIAELVEVVGDVSREDVIVEVDLQGALMR